ncbi:hypothetical protein [uncultured Flavobacterium sp.]|uniref:hypothetical protein n=1 Tax=uncultured Flavobacterium sp. TaxID=165435 RepID=UPI00121709D3|nr:hypothetical protein [uncultured Flavobacterium sp.]THD30371.1 MAG: hypothetical protein DI588_16545 [Flavobacterium johnsoniae]
MNQKQKTINFLFLIFTLFNFSCQKRDKKMELYEQYANKNIDSSYIEMFYIGPNISTPFSYPCSMISKEVLKDDINYKKIDDKQKIKKFMDLYSKYETAVDSGGMNIRIKVLIHNKTKTDTLCLGEHFNTYKNGTKMKDNKQLLNYVKDIIDYENTVSSFVKKHPERYKSKQ